MVHYHFLILGREKRQQYLAELLKEQGHKVMCGEDYLPGYHDAVLLPVPQTAVYMEKIWKKLQKDQIVYGCNFPQDKKEICEKRGISFVDYMKEEGVAERNAVATAEGAIAEALKKGKVGIQHSKVMVLGYGTCGAMLSHKLMAWKADVIVAERKESKREQAKAYGCQAISFEDIPGEIGQCDIVFNTVPALVLQERELSHVSPNVILIDIASKPGGVDFDYCRKNNICADLCLGLPGKYAPKSSAGILMEVIIKTILGD